MNTILTLIALVAGGSIFNYIYPITIPPVWVGAIENLLNPLYGFNAFVPVQTFFSDLSWFVLLMVVYLFYKLVMGLLGLLSGGGVPEI